MTTYEKMTKKELITTAKSLEIQGYSKMTKTQLIESLVESETPEVEEIQTIDEVVENVIPFGDEDEDENEFVPGSNHIPTTPYRQRVYGVTHKVEEVYKKLPNQARKIYDFLADTGFTGTGPAIVKSAIERDYVQTRQDPAVLYAFYARKLEDAGVSLV